MGAQRPPSFGALGAAEHGASYYSARRHFHLGLVGVVIIYIASNLGRLGGSILEVFASRFPSQGCEIEPYIWLPTQRVAS